MTNTITPMTTNDVRQLVLDLGEIGQQYINKHGEQPEYLFGLFPWHTNQVQAKQLKALSSKTIADERTLLENVALIVETMPGKGELLATVLDCMCRYSHAVRAAMQAEEDICRKGDGGATMTAYDAKERILLGAMAYLPESPWTESSHKTYPL